MNSGIAIVFLGSLFAGLYLLARAIPAQAYRRVVTALALGPAVIWALVGLTSSRPLLVLGMALGLALAVFALGRLAARVAG